MVRIKVESKKCTKCKKILPATEEYFYKQKVNSKTKGMYYKFMSWCRTCWIESRKQFQQENYHNTGKLKEYHQQRWEENKDWILEQQAEYYQDNKNKRKEYHSEWSKTDNGKEWLRNYYQENRDKKKHRISEKEWVECKRYFNDSCAYCGLSNDEHKKIYKKGLHREHAINKGANDLSNCVPACAKCNTEKHTDDYNIWFIQENPVFEQEKLQKILMWLYLDHKQYIKKRIIIN